MNTQVKLASRPVGAPDDSTWNIETNPIPTPEEGEFVVKNLFVSVDPAMRGWIRDVPSYIPPVQIGAVMRAGAVGKVVASKHPKFKVGDYATGMLNAQQYALTDGKGIRKVQAGLAPLPAYLGVLGLTGMTAYFGLLKVGLPKAGETVLVSGAAGATGSIVGQIAKIKGCRVVGIAGGAEKCQYLIDELGFDAAIDYKNENVKKAIRKTCPKGVDIYFDNVGGSILDAALANINFKARVVLCGAISQYNATTPPPGPQNYLQILVRSARMEGFIVLNYAKEYGSAAMELGSWLAQGKIKAQRTVVDGIENFNAAFMKLFSGDKKGKVVVKVGDDD